MTNPNKDALLALPEPDGESTLLVPVTTAAKLLAERDVEIAQLRDFIEKAHIALNAMDRVQAEVAALRSIAIRHVLHQGSCEYFVDGLNICTCGALESAIAAARAARENKNV